MPCLPKRGAPSKHGARGICHICHIWLIQHGRPLRTTTRHHGRVRTVTDDRAPSPTTTRRHGRPRAATDDHAPPRTTTRRHGRPRAATDRRPRVVTDDHAPLRATTRRHGRPRAVTDDHAPSQTIARCHGRPHAFMGDHTPSQMTTHRHGRPRAVTHDHAPSHSRTTTRRHRRPRAVTDDHAPSRTTTHRHARPCTHLLQVLLEFSLRVLHLLDPTRERHVDRVGLLAHVARRVRQHVVDETAQLDGRHPLVLGARDVVVAELRPRLRRRLAARRRRTESAGYAGCETKRH